MPPHFSKGSETDIAFVLSCPGRHEEAAEYPAAGSTGKNLERLLKILGPRLGFPDLIRAHVTIANAWCRIEYKQKTQRSEASKEEVMLDTNIDRLADELQHVKMLIVFCGRNAQLTSQKLRLLNRLSESVQMASICHLGFQGLNKIKCDISSQSIVKASEQRRCGCQKSKKVIQQENTDRRLKVVVERLLQSCVPMR